MSFRERMRVKESNAERDVFIELQNRHLCDGMVTQQPFKFDRVSDGVAGTWVDFFYGPPLDYAAFVDFDKLHLKNRQWMRDVLVTAALERRGVLVDRFLYRVPLRKGRLKEICDSIERRVKET